MNLDQARRDYRAALQPFDRLVLRRYTGGGTSRPRFDASCDGRVLGYKPDELVGNIQQGDRRVIVMAEDLTALGFALPVTTADKVVFKGKELSVQHADHTTRSLNGVTIAIDIQVRG